MDPASGLGLAASVCQLLQCAEKLVKTTGRLRESANGVLGENHEIETTVTDLVELVTRLPLILSQSAAGENQGEKLRSICKMSTDVAEELLDMLGTMKVADPSKRWVVARKALRSMLREGDKQRLLERLGKLQTQLTLHMQGDLVASFRRMDKKLDAIVSATCVAEIATSVLDATPELIIEVCQPNWPWRAAAADQELRLRRRNHFSGLRCPKTKRQP